MSKEGDFWNGLGIPKKRAEKLLNIAIELSKDKERTSEFLLALYQEEKLLELEKIAIAYAVGVILERTREEEFLKEAFNRGDLICA